MPHPAPADGPVAAFTPFHNPDCQRVRTGRMFHVSASACSYWSVFTCHWPFPMADAASYTYGITNFHAFICVGKNWPSGALHDPPENPDGTLEPGPGLAAATGCAHQFTCTTESFLGVGLQCGGWRSECRHCAQRLDAPWPTPQLHYRHVCISICDRASSWRRVRRMRAPCASAAWTQASDWTRRGRRRTCRSARRLRRWDSIQKRSSISWPSAGRYTLTMQHTMGNHSCVEMLRPMARLPQRATQTALDFCAEAKQLHIVCRSRQVKLSVPSYRCQNRSCFLAASTLRRKSTFWPLSGRQSASAPALIVSGIRRRTLCPLPSA